MPGHELAGERLGALDLGRAPRRAEDGQAEIETAQAVLKYAAGLFTAGRIYTEKEANQVLERLNPDTAMLRRNLVDYGFLLRERDGSAYWLSQEESR